MGRDCTPQAPTAGHRRARTRFGSAAIPREMVEFTIEPRSTFSLAAAQRFLGGFTPASGTFASDDTRLTMAFPVDGWAGSAAAVVWQEGALVRGEAVVSSPDVAMDVVRDQVARTLSLDHDGTGWEEVGRRDPVIG